MPRAAGAYLQLRALTLGRQVRELGWWRLLLLGPLFLAAVGRVGLVLASHPSAYWLLPPVAAGLVLGHHRRRTDLTFLHLSAPAYRGWLAAEYCLLVMPIVGVLLAFERWEAALLTPLVGGLAWLPAAAPRSTRQHGRSIFRSEALELVGGFRHPAMWLGYGALLGAAAWWRQYPLAPALATALWVLLLTGCYGTPEPWTWLLPALRRPGSWLRRRLGWALAYFSLTAAPLLFLMGTGPAGWGAALGLLLSGGALMTMVVTARYAFYPHALLVRLTQGGVLALAALLTAHPIYPVLLLVAFGGLWWKAHRRLAEFRHD